MNFVPELYKNFFWIGLGSALGGMARFALTVFVASRIPGNFPLGTLLVNISGSFVIGVVAVMTDDAGRIPISQAMRQFLMIGICGGYTTFSSFSLQTLNLLREDQWGFASLNILLSVALCLLAVWLGFRAGEVFNR